MTDPTTTNSDPLAPPYKPAPVPAAAQPSVTDPPRRTSLAVLVGQIATSLAPPRATMPRAELRRAAPGDATSPAFWQTFIAFVAPSGWGRTRAGEEARAARERRWAAALGVLAELAGLHDPRRSLGGALARAGVSEARVTRLFRAEEGRLWSEARAVAHQVGAAGATCDHAEFVALLLSDEAHLDDWHGRVTQKIARDYYAERGRNAG